MKATQEQRKQKAVELMKKLDIFKPYMPNCAKCEQNGNLLKFAS